MNDMETIAISTTQNIDLEYELAGVGDRVLAALIDITAQAAYLLLMFFFAMIAGVESLWVSVVIFLPVFLYEVLMESVFNGQTLGKMSRRIRVIQVSGAAPTVGSYLLRWLIRMLEVSASFGSVALLVLLINGKGQRLGDLAAGTTVVRLRRAVGLDETILTSVAENYRPQFLAADRLTERDIEIVKEVLRTNPEAEDTVAIRNRLEEKLQAIIEKKLDIQSNMPATLFLETIVKDYNSLKGRL
ncbi:MAG: RDD family protein [Ignavibacteriae bacterium]|nr:RDD family protein [Ignavibacteriota bacterium]